MNKQKVFKGLMELVSDVGWSGFTLAALARNQEIEELELEKLFSDEISLLQAFSEFIDDRVISTYVNCNNCGVAHKIIDLCKSEILEKSEDFPVVNLNDLMFSLPKDLRDVFDSYDVDMPTIQNALWIIDNSKWGEKVILVKRELEDRIEGKCLVFKAPNQYRIETFLEDKNEF